MELRIGELQGLFKILVDKLEGLNLTEFKFESDNYWVISPDERVDFSTGSPNLCVGSLKDDLDSLKRVLNGSNPLTPVDFDRLASVLVAIGEAISHSKEVF